MALFIAQSGGPVNMNVGQGELDVIAISQIDSGVGFDETNTTDIEGVTCIPVSYTQNETGPTSDRLNDLVNEVSYTSPPQIVIFPVQNPDAFTLSDGTPLKGNGFAFPVGNADSPFTSNVCTLYDITLCGGDGMWCDQEGGGRVMITTETMLYHELSHCFHFVTGTAAAGAQEEVNAEIDENDMRDVRGIPHRDVNSHDGGCGGGVDPCCIVASLSTGSPYSTEINRFRHIREHSLRYSAVGEDFFKEFFHRYYEFSPEVCRLMGHQPNLTPLIKDKFVVPLLAGSELLIHYAESKGTGFAEFLRRQSRREGMDRYYQKHFLDELQAFLKIARHFDGKTISRVLKTKGKEFSGFNKLLRHINTETVKNEYIGWALVSVVEIWVESALLLYSTKSDDEIDFYVYEKIVEWIAYLPVSNVWDNMSRIQTEVELQSLEDFIFDSRSKEVFSERLIDEHPKYSATIRRWAESKGGKDA